MQIKNIIPIDRTRSGISAVHFIFFTFCAIFNSAISTLQADELHAHPGAIVFIGTEGKSLNTARSIFIYSELGTSINWSQSSNVSWVSANPGSGVTETDSVLSVGADITGMSPGIYHGNIVIDSPESDTGPVTIDVTLIINPDVPVSITTWKNGFDGAMSVSVDDSKSSGFAPLQANGFSGTYLLEWITPPAYYTTYYNAGMELGSHTYHHPCSSIADDVLRYQEIEPNIEALVNLTPEPAKDIISFAWPCGYTNYREQSVLTDYFLSARGYNINLLEDPTPDNFMNLKSFNSHESYPFPPSDLKTVVDQAVAQKKWFNLVLHDYTNDDGAINYSASKNIWVTAIGNVIKYILQRDRFILTNYSQNTNTITYSISRLQIPSSSYRSFETAFGPKDSVTMQVDVDDSRIVESVSIDGSANHFLTKNIDGNIVLLTNVKLDPDVYNTVEIRYQQTSVNLTVTGITANNKVYDGTTAATLNTGSAVLNGVIAGDDVTLIVTGAAGTFADKNAGSGKTVTISGLTLAGADAGKYTLTQPVSTADITPLDLTILGVSANNKVYNGITSATLNTEGATLAGVLGGDIVSPVFSGATGDFADKNTGTGKTVTISGIALGGAGAVNYTLTQPATTADITPATLTVAGVTANNKVYDGTTATTLNTGSASLVAVFGGDVVTLNSTTATGTFANKNIGLAKLVTISGLTISGASADNYILNQPLSSADISKATLTISGVTANNKIYDGTVVANLNTFSAHLVGVYSGDIVNFDPTGASGNFANKNAGIDKSVATSGFIVTGVDAGNYSLMQQLLSADITPKVLTITGLFTANDKEYDGSNSATIISDNLSLLTTEENDNVILNPVAVFAGSEVGIGKLVTLNGSYLTGTDLQNYILSLAGSPTTIATITASGLTVTGITADSRIYSGSLLATINTANATLRGVVGSDIVNLELSGASGIFETKDAGSGKTVNITGLAISGPDAGKYLLISPTTRADITPAALTVSGVTANDKAYDGTTLATLDVGSAVLEGVIGADEVSLETFDATAIFADKNSGNGKHVSVSGFKVIGNDANDYILTQPTLSANIKLARLMVTGVKISNKTYDGTTQAEMDAGSASLDGIKGGDDVHLISTGASAHFTDKKAGSGKQVLTSGFSIGGSGAGNYVLIQPSPTADVLPKVLTITINNLSKTYGKELIFSGEEFSAAGLVIGDTIPDMTLRSTGASPAAPAGSYSITAGGAENSCYVFNYINGKLQVVPAPLNIKADDKTKAYGQVNPSFTISYSGFVAGEDKNSLVVPAVAEANAGIYSNTGNYDIKISGAVSPNYTIIYENGILNITKADQFITFAQIPDKLRMTQKNELIAESSSGLPVTFETSSPENIIVNGNILEIIKEGIVAITARQPGDSNWNPAADVTQTITTLPTFDGISSLFTPNGDGMNDFWYIPALEEYGKLEVTVYNRYGQAVYKSDDYKNDWDGTWNGYPLPTASYYYIIKSSAKGFIKGVVNIVR